MESDPEKPNCAQLVVREQAVDDGKQSQGDQGDERWALGPESKWHTISTNPTR